MSATLFPNLRGRVNLAFVEPDDICAEGLRRGVFRHAQRHRHEKRTPMLLEARCQSHRSGCRFPAPATEDWERWYGMPHACPDLLAEAVYGLPEVNREAIRKARLVANPGCYPTAVQLGFLPLLEAGVVDSQSLIADAKSGVSGAGRKAEVGILLAEAGDNFKAYNVSGHRHLPEIRQGLAAVAGDSLDLVFVPHLTPMIRGIHATLYATLTTPDADLQALFEQRYGSQSRSWMSCRHIPIPRPAACAGRISVGWRCIGRGTARPWWCCR
jgi:N-acetyl-gamma-glutamyl-phosphate reductase